MPAEVTPRRFPPPWTVEETDACFIVRDHNGQALAYVYSRMSRAVARRRISSPATRARRIAVICQAARVAWSKRGEPSTSVQPCRMPRSL